MRVILAVVLLVGLLGGYVIARQKYRPMMLAKDKMILDRDSEIKRLNQQCQVLGLKGVMMKDDKMYTVWTTGENKLMTQDMMAPDNVTKLMMDGKIVKSDGTVVTLTNGEIYTFDGKVTMEK